MKYGTRYAVLNKTTGKLVTRQGPISNRPRQLWNNKPHSFLKELNAKPREVMGFHGEIHLVQTKDMRINDYQHEYEIIKLQLVKELVNE